MGRDRSQKEPKFRRVLDVFNATMVTLGAIIGAGIFVAIGEAAKSGGPSIVLGFFIAAFLAALNAYSSVELGIAFPYAGGAYEFGRRLVSPLLGFIAGWLFLLGGISASAAYALTFASYLKPILPGLPIRFVSVTFAVLATLINYFGIVLSVRINNVLTFAKIAALILFVFASAFAFDGSNFAPFFPREPLGLFTASAILFFAYAGYSRPITVVEEVTDPRKVLPKTAGLSLTITTLLYLGVAIAGIGAIGSAGLAATDAPLYAASVRVSRTAATLVAIGGLITALSVILSEVMGLSRVLYAMARSGDLPSWFASINAQYGVPSRAIAVVGVAIVALSFFAGLGPLIEASSLFVLIYYSVNNIAALRLREKALYSPIVPGAGLILSLVLAVSLPLRSLIVTAISIAVALAYFAVRWGLSR